MRLEELRHHLREFHGILHEGDRPTMVHEHDDLHQSGSDAHRPDPHEHHG